MTPGSPEWAKRVTASKVAAILGVSPWESPRSVWHLMHGDLPREESTEVQRRGHYLEPAILAWWRDQHGVLDGEFKVQPEYKLDEWAAATPDMVTHVKAYDHENVLVEAKSTADDGDWGEPGTDEIPDYYLVQVFWQMHVSGIHRCYVPVIGPRLRFVEYVVDYNERYGQALERTMRKFYESLSADEPPPLDESLATYKAIRRIHSDIDDKSTVEIPESLAVPFLETVRDIKDTEDKDRLYRSRVIDAMGRANFATCNGIKVARRQRGNGGVSFVPLPNNLDLITELETAS